MIWCTLVLMISPPTDRLHKFLAIGGVALLIGSTTVPLQKYQDAEAQRIEALTRAQEVQFTYQRYANHVNRMIRLQNEAVSSGLDGPELDAAKAEVRALDPEAEKLGRETEKVIVELVKQSELAVHMGQMRNVWFGLAIVGAILGAWMSFVGFRQWISIPRHER